MRTAARIGDGPVATTQGVLTKRPSGALSVPVEFRDLEGVESIALGFRQHMFSLGDIGEVATGAGWGTDAIIMRWGDRQCLVRGLDLLAAWVRTFDPDIVAEFPIEAPYGYTKSGRIRKRPLKARRGT